jgi:hypothetical protein
LRRSTSCARKGRQSPDEGLEQTREVARGALGVGQRLLMAQRHVGQPFREVGDGRDGGHAHAGVARDDRLVDGRHPDRVGAHGAKGADLGRGLEARPADGEVDALGQVDPEVGGARAQLIEERGVVGAGQAGEARADRVVVGADQRVVPGEVDVVGDRHQAARPDLRAQRAGGVGQHEDLGAGSGQRPHRGDARRRVAALVEVRAAHEHAHRHAAQPAEHGAAGVAVDGRAREAGQLVVADADRVLDGVGHRAQARAEDDAHARRDVRAQDGGRLARAHARDSSSKASGSSCAMVVVCSGPPGRPR